MISCALLQSKGTVWSCTGSQSELAPDGEIWRVGKLRGGRYSSEVMTNLSKWVPAPWMDRLTH